MAKINIGIDLGPTSNAIAILDEKMKLKRPIIIHRFKDACDAKSGLPINKSRREYRHTRRRVQRRNNRRRDFLELLIREKLISTDTDFYQMINAVNAIPYQLKLNGCLAKLSIGELIFCLFHYLKHRGLTFHKDSTEVENLVLNTKVDKLPSQIQKDSYEKQGFIKGSVINNAFSRDQWKKEILLFLSKQNLTSDFKKQYMQIFERNRSYAYGPGNKFTQTKYGLCFENINQGKNETLWDKNIGHCIIYPEEKRSLAKSASAEMSNILTNLNNLRIDGIEEWRISPEEKENILKEVILDNKKPSLSLISKLIWNLNSQFSDYFSNSKDLKNALNLRQINEECKNIRTYYKIFNPCEFFPWKNVKQLNVINDLIFNLSKIPNKSEKEEFLQKQGHTSDVIKQLLDEKNGISCQARTAKLSIKALNEFIPLLFKSSSGEILSNFVLNRKILQKEDYSNMSFKQAFLKNVANEILSPSVKRSCWEFIKILSKLKLDKNVDTNIVIELPRATNSKEQRKLESELQKINKERKEKIEKKYKKYEIKNQNFDEATIYRLALFDSQDGKDIYTGKPLKIQDVINNVNMHIDHILAKSITCDNTSHNKVLTTLDNNKNKGIMTPYEFLGTKFEKIKKQYWDNLLKNHMISQQKYSNLSRVTPLNKDALGFVARNITDTGYISCLLSEFLQKFYENTSIKIIISNGKFTNFIRSKILKVNKDRKFYSHHGVDAVCCSIVGMLPKTTIDKMRWSVQHPGVIEEDGSLINHGTGEIIFNYNDLRKIVGQAHIKETLHESDSFRYSTPLIKHPTKALHADTLYSGKINEKNGTVEVISKIHIFKDYGKEHKKLFDKWFLKKEFSELRIDNKIMLNILIKIYEQYSSEKQGNVNPFISYMSDIYKINNPDYVYIPLNNEKVIRIKFLRYVVNGKKLLWKTLKNEKLAHSRKNRIGMFDNLEWTQMRVYSLNGKYWVFPINALVNKIDHGKITVDENKVDSLLKEITKQDCKLKLIDTWYKGEKFIDKDKEIYELSSYHFNFKSIQLKSIVKKEDKPQQYYSLSKIFIENKYKKVHIDILGNIYV